MGKKDVGDAALETWIGLNKVIRAADEALCRKLLATEKRGRNRVTFLTRIHSRLNRVRAAVERARLRRGGYIQFANRPDTRITLKYTKKGKPVITEAKLKGD